MSVKIKILASGSKGNSYFLSDGRTRILIDAGIPFASLLDRLEAIDESEAAIDAVFVTHEHGDHTNGLLGLLRASQPPVYASSGTLKALSPLLTRTRSVAHTLQPEMIFQFGSTAVLPMVVPHDAAEPFGYTFLVGGMRVAFIADVGHISDSMASVLCDVDFLFLESNHDVSLLDAGDYLPRLKARVFCQHLSNRKVAGFIAERLEQKVKYLVLGHLSESNNRIDLVGTSALEALRKRGVSPELTVVEPNRGSSTFVF